MPLVACSGACVDPRYDPGHCGSCNACPAVPNANNFCFNAACGIASCSANTEDCNGVVADGCEVDKLTNDSNCGACGNACAAGTACSNGTCMPTSYTVGGTLTGITAGTLILRNNGADNLVRTADGGFTFATPVSSGQPYAVTVFQQPTGQFCAVTNGSGVVGAANVTNVAVACVVSVLANGSFESAFSGWTLARAASSASCGGATIVSSGTTLSTGSVVNEAIAGAPLTITFPSTALPRTYTALSAANGTSMAVLFTANCPENTKASQLFTIPSGATSIAFAVQYSSGIALNTGSQHVMVTLLDPNTNALLATLYSVGTGSPQSASMTAVSVNIASLAGRMVRLQLDVQGQSFPLFAAFDAFLVQ